MKAVQDDNLHIKAKSEEYIGTVGHGVEHVHTMAQMINDHKNWANDQVAAELGKLQVNPDTAKHTLDEQVEKLKDMAEKTMKDIEGVNTTMIRIDAEKHGLTQKLENAMGNGMVKAGISLFEGAAKGAFTTGGGAGSGDGGAVSASAHEGPCHGQLHGIRYFRTLMAMIMVRG